MPTAATDWAAAKLAIVAIKLCASIGEDPDRLLDPKFNGRPKAPGGPPCEAAAAAAIAAAIAAAAAVLWKEQWNVYTSGEKLIMFNKSMADRNK